MKTIKTFFALLFAGVAGGALVFFVGKNQLETLVEEKVQNESKVEPTALVKDVDILDMPLTFAKAAKLATPAVVQIKAVESEEAARRRYEQWRYNNPFDWLMRDPFGGGGNFYRKGGTGSGVIVSGDGYIVTNNHVVSFSDEITVSLPDNRTFEASLVGRDARTDLAVLKIDAENLPTLEYADSDKAQVGDWVLAVGNPFDYLSSTVTAGIISAKGRDINIIRDQDNGMAIESFIQTDAAVNPGNSGGALVDVEGRLLGINTAIATPTGAYAGYSFAIPVNLMQKIVDDIITYGEYKRVTVGVNIIEVNEGVAEEYTLDTTNGVMVAEVVEGSAAENAGLLPYDVITAVNGRDIRTANELLEVVGSSRFGDVLEIEVNRNGRERLIPVKLIEG